MTRGPGAAAIASELRARILSGELAVGQKVPSTRELTRRWGVAMATASKALAMLRQEGLTRPVPGVGTVVAATSATARLRPRAASDAGLDAETIVATAMRVADVEGLEAVSMRRVAAELGAATMSLYRHVADKDDLVLRMQEAALGEWEPPDPPPAGWRARLEVAAAALWAAFRTHPWLATVMSLTRPTPLRKGLAFTEWCLAALRDEPIPLQEAFDVQLILFNLVRGVALGFEAEAAATAETGLDSEEWLERSMPALQALVASGRFPMMSRMLAEDYDLDLDLLARSGITYLLDGLAVRLQRARR
ncbi:TetR/AcrR family transcriptional regulator C-terminal domain-containing protein [Pseudonocardia thermophila]|uniref:TetR/AcrR family transcriptional regulator C-terminal domain-containing protein n=1 Tax=Pseudonocardia thermophila TaxID=1848 RepID=UPI00093683E2|nr:GntR family transcriptional regulator [Pseudonocardia thermophila]